MQTERRRPYTLNLPRSPFDAGIAVTSGSQYIALVTNVPGGVSLGDSLDGTGGGTMILMGNDPYPGGMFFFKGGNPESGDWHYVLDQRRETTTIADAVFHANFADPPPTTTIFSLDIKPGGDANPINLKSNGVLPVAIVTTDLFNAADVNPDTLLFGDPVLLDAGGTGVSPIRSSLEDVTGDGLLDLSLKFSIPKMIDAGILDQSSDKLQLTGSTWTGTSIAGTDTIRIVPTHMQIIPEPTTLFILITSAAVICCHSRRRQNLAVEYRP